MTPTGKRVSRSQQNSTAKKVSKSKLTPKATDTKKKLKSPKLKKKMNSKSLSWHLKKYLAGCLEK